MRNGNLFVLLAVFSIAIFGCTQNTADAMEKKDAMIGKEKTMTKDSMEKSEESMEKSSTMEKEGEVMKKDEAMMENPYAGKALAGTESTKYLDFSKADYDKALKEKKKILLYFYANWCPICKKEQVDTFAAFNEINNPDLIGFRVNYRDGDDDEFEKELAKEFGVSYQHTKIILKDGQRVLKAPDSWDKQRYLDELSKV